MLGAWRGAVARVVAGQGVLSEELRVVLVLAARLHELADLLRVRLLRVGAARRPLGVTPHADGLGRLESGLRAVNRGGSLLHRRLTPHLEHRRRHGGEVGVRAGLRRGGVEAVWDRAVPGGPLHHFASSLGALGHEVEGPLAVEAGLLHPGGGGLLDHHVGGGP